MIRPEKWWWGTIPLAALGFFAVHFQQTAIEADIAKRANEVASQTRLSTQVAGRDVLLQGYNFRQEGVDQTLANIRSLNGVRLVSDDTDKPPLKSPFIWGIEKKDRIISIEGSVSSPYVQEDLFRSAQNLFPSGEVRDRTTFASGTPEGFVDTTALAVKALALLKEGKLILLDNQLTGSGKAEKAAIKTTFLDLLKTLPSSITLGDIKIDAPPPFSFHATKSDGSLLLNGFIPDEESRNTILNDARRLFYKEKIIDQLTISSDTPESFMTLVRSGLFALSRLEKGSFSFDDYEGKISGNAFYEKAVAGIQEQLGKAAPKGFTIHMDEITPLSLQEEVEISQCQQNVNDLLTKTMIHFDTNESSISEYSSGLLDNLAAFLYQCPLSQIEIIGHTDSTGDDEANLELSKKRADAVQHYLVTAGIAAHRMSTQGVGASQPVADNQTDEGRALNRRIDFILK